MLSFHETVAQNEINIIPNAIIPHSDLFSVSVLNTIKRSVDERNTELWKVPEYQVALNNVFKDAQKDYNTAFEFLIDDDLEQAFHYFERAESKLKIVNNIPLLNQTRIGLSICYYKSNKFKEGKKELRQVAFIQLDNMLWHIKGDLFYLMGFFKDSETVYKEIIQSFPDDIVAYQKLKGLYVDSLQSDRKLKRLQEQYAKHFNH